MSGLDQHAHEAMRAFRMMVRSLRQVWGQAAPGVDRELVADLICDLQYQLGDVLSGLVKGQVRAEAVRLVDDVTR